MTSTASEPTDADDRRWCHDALQGTSRTFALTVSALDEPMATEVCVSYLLCRVADTVEDAGHIPDEDQAELLSTYSRALDPDDATEIEAFVAAVEPWLPADLDDDWTVVARADRVGRTFDGLDPTAKAAVRDPIRELVDGMAMFVERHTETGGIRIESLDELEEYCWYVAGTVGTLVTNLLARDAPPERVRHLREHDRAFGLLLQLVNVAKDVTDDYYEENNVYLPAAWLREHDVDQERVCADENVPAVASVVRRVAEHATGYLDGARTYLEATPETSGNTLAAWAVPYLLAVGTLRELTDRPEDVIREGGVKVSQAEVFAIVEQFAEGVDREALSALSATVARQPFHRAG
ncbi:phytoene/squalene synthase family protein [Halococcus salsus]|uniref:phytoene/squalene synthase family protein n=1 Tax=Halococcus salsus TaxID=2162894 RepID=UPI001356D73B|nr:phytoene/squalene synthase family protein [Halococcus salsus]